MYVSERFYIDTLYVYENQGSVRYIRPVVPNISYLSTD
jgi:hypothetical protein